MILWVARCISLWASIPATSFSLTLQALFGSTVPPPAGLPFFGLPCNGALTSYSSFRGITSTMCLPFYSTICSSWAFPCCARLAPLAVSFHACTRSCHMPWTPTPWVRRRWLVSPACRPNAGSSLSLGWCALVCAHQCPSADFPRVSVGVHSHVPPRICASTPDQLPSPSRRRS